MMSIPHFLDSRLTDGGKVVGSTHWPHSTPQKHYISESYSWEFVSCCVREIKGESVFRLRNFNIVGFSTFILLRYMFRS
jgi:hypothetical protein